MSEKKRQNNVGRKEPLNLWLFFLGAALVHGVVILGLSPSLYTQGEDTSPEGLHKKAQALAAEEKYEEAFHTYELLMAKKPQMPAIFEKGEKEMQQVRLKMLEKQRQQTQKAREEADKKQDEGQEPETSETSGEKEEDTTEGEGETPPQGPAELPELPGIE